MLNQFSASAFPIHGMVVVGLYFGDWGPTIMFVYSELTSCF